MGRLSIDAGSAENGDKTKDVIFLPQENPIDIKALLIELKRDAHSLQHAYVVREEHRLKEVRKWLDRLPKRLKSTHRLLKTAAVYDNGELLVFQSRQALEEKLEGSSTDPDFGKLVPVSSPRGGIFRYRVEGDRRVFVGNHSFEDLKRRAPCDLRGCTDILDGYIDHETVVRKLHDSRSEPWHPFYWAAPSQFTRLHKEGHTESFTEVLESYRGSPLAEIAFKSFNEQLDHYHQATEHDERAAALGTLIATAIAYLKTISYLLKLRIGTFETPPESKSFYEIFKLSVGSANATEADGTVTYRVHPELLTTEGQAHSRPSAFHASFYH